MEAFCRALHPDLNLSPTCMSWYRQATQHCINVMLRKRDLGVCFWTTVKNFIFPERQTAVMNDKISIAIHPNRLTAKDCHALLLDIVNDYITRAPRYSVETTMNVLLWQIIYSLMGIMALGSLLVSTIFIYRKFKTSSRPYDPLQTVFAPEKRACAYVNRNLRIIKYELHRLRLQHIIQPEELFHKDGSLTMVIKLSSKFNFVEGIVAGNVLAGARLYRMHQSLGRKKPDYKLETVPKVMNFINNCSRKLHMLFIFDDEYNIYDELQLVKDSTRSPTRAHLKVPPMTSHSPANTQLSKVAAAAAPTAQHTAKSPAIQRSMCTHIPRNYARSGQTPRNRTAKPAV